MQILAVTGGVACGKSTITALFGALGAPTLSADDLARDLLRPGTETADAVLAAFPRCASQDRADTVDRRALGRLIFADTSARKRLEAITHPPIIKALRTAADRWRCLPGGCAVLEIPLLFEAGLQYLPDKILVAVCTPEQQLDRLIHRPGVGEQEARHQIAAQWPLEEKKKNAFRVIDTSISREETKNQVLALWEACCQ